MRGPSFRFVFPALLLAFCPLWVVACGGGGGGGREETGSAQIVVTWPSRSRLIPAAANSINAVFLQGQTEIASQILARPSSGNQTTATFNNLKVGSLTLAATAYPQANGSGVAQATGATPITIVSGQTASVQLTMSSTIDHLDVAPSASPAVAVGATLPFTVTARDSSGALVLTLPNTIQWFTGSSALATINASGVATGVAPTGATPGKVVISVTETESGKTASVDVAVTSNTTVAVNPPAPTLSVGDPQTLTATVANAPNTAVTWSVKEGTAGGSVTAGGVYTAPATPGTYHVIATSVYDNAKKATATVTVQAGNASVVIK